MTQPNPLADFRKFLFVVWKHLNLPDPTPVQYDIAKPDIDYEFNYGAVLLLGFDTFVVGARVTSESSQLTLGLKF